MTTMKKEKKLDQNIINETVLQCLTGGQFWQAKK